MPAVDGQLDLKYAFKFIPQNMNMGIDSCAEEYENIDLKYSQVNDLIINYLVHHCYDSTLQEFPIKSDLLRRKEVLKLILDGKPREARSMLKGIPLGECDFLIASLEFVELIKQNDYSYLEFDFSRFSSQPQLPDLISLIAFENPKSWYLTKEYQEYVANKVNTLLTGDKWSKLEGVLRQAVAVREEMASEGEYPPWKL